MNFRRTSLYPREDISKWDIGQLIWNRSLSARNYEQTYNHSKLTKTSSSFWEVTIKREHYTPNENDLRIGIGYPDEFGFPRLDKEHWICNERREIVHNNQRRRTYGNHSPNKDYINIAVAFQNETLAFFYDSDRMFDYFYIQDTTLQAGISPIAVLKTDYGPILRHYPIIVVKVIFYQ